MSKFRMPSVHWTQKHSTLKTAALRTRKTGAGGHESTIQFDDNITLPLGQGINSTATSTSP